VGFANGYLLLIATHAALRRKSKDWMARNQNNVSEGAGIVTLPEHLGPPQVFSGIRVTRSLVLNVCFVDRWVFAAYRYACSIKEKEQRLDGSESE
jgi:hypothetical protein